ncbi:hypothetical protein MYX64_08210 [Nitrospinae bacterium AH_259_B05_G02_I21]|nr:hypothetical protein [Nitrospinae bacterium AH_259_B05_G02_I21]MDA2932471.1 hypothetical protein [Nitrospinae bacterium AH-259-F20]
MVKKVLSVVPVPMQMKSRWDACARPPYLFGLLHAAYQAIDKKVPAISAIEFGVADGEGLLILEEYASAVERETGVITKVYGFDTGKGYPELCGDYRDHPDMLNPGQYPMDEAALRQRLSSRTTLIIGDVAQSVPDFVRDSRHPPVGFIACDFATYSSTRDALQVLSLPGKRMLMKVPMCFGNIAGLGWHQFAGELLAIAELNAKNHNVKIDQWHGISSWRVFPEAPWLQSMYVAHDLEAISKAQ